MNIENTTTRALFPGVKDGETFWIGNMEFIKFPSIGDQTPAVMKDIAFFSQFGASNDFRSSTVLNRMEKEILPKIVEEIGADKLCTIKTDLRTLDGLNPYGEMESLISLPTMDFYRTHVEIFDQYKPDRWWWLATPESAQPHCDPDWTLCVSPSGFFDYFYCSSFAGGVRPFLIFHSSIFGSSER